MWHGAVGLAHLTCNWSDCEFEPHQGLLLFPWARNITLIAQCWLVSETDSSM